MFLMGWRKVTYTTQTLSIVHRIMAMTVRFEKITFIFIRRKSRPTITPRIAALSQSRSELTYVLSTAVNGDIMKRIVSDNL